MHCSRQAVPQVVYNQTWMTHVVPSHMPHIVFVGRNLTATTLTPPQWSANPALSFHRQGKITILEQADESTHATSLASDATGTMDKNIRANLAISTHRSISRAGLTLPPTSSHREGRAICTIPPLRLHLVRSGHHWLRRIRGILGRW
jgi:hypothetical protein